jgi:hypothetical protein
MPPTVPCARTDTPHDHLQPPQVSPLLAGLAQQQRKFTKSAHYQFAAGSNFQPQRMSGVTGRAAASYPSGLTGVDLFWRPVPRHEVFELGHLLIGDVREDPSQPRFGIDLVHAAGLNEGVGDGRCFAAAF